MTLLAQSTVLLSPEARKLLRELERLSDFIPREQWPLHRQGFFEYMQPLSDAAAVKYIASLEESSLEGIPLVTFTPKGYRADNDDKIMIYLHGGAYALGSPKCQLHIPAPVAQLASLRCLCIDYPLAPEHPFPAAQEACFALYRTLLKTYRPKHIFLMGDSAGGALALATALRASESELPLPGGIIAYSPACDLLQTSPTYSTPGEAELSPKLTPDFMTSITDLFSEGEARSPYASPLYADYSGRNFPPLFLTTGSLDLLRGECTLLKEKLESAGTEVTFFEDPGLWHNYQEDPETPETLRTAERAAAFLQACILNN